MKSPKSKILRIKEQGDRWKRNQARCDTDRGFHVITQLGGGDFYSGLMHIDLIAAQVRVAVRNLGIM